LKARFYIERGVCRENPMQDSILLAAATVLFYFLAFPDQLRGLVA